MFSRVGGGDELSVPASESVDGDDEFLGFQDPSVELFGESRKPSTLIVGWSDPLDDQALEDAGLFVQKVNDEVEFLLDGSRTGDNQKCGFVGDGRVAHGASAWA